MSRTLRKIAITLPPELVDSIDYIVGRLGISRSAFIAGIMGEAVAPLLPLLESVPLDPTPADVLRFRGDSAAVVQGRIEKLKGMTDDLLNDA